MKKLILGVDLQNDFITGKLGSDDAQAIIPKITNYFNSLINANTLTCDDDAIAFYNDNDGILTSVIFTMDTHFNRDFTNYIDGKFPKHCLKNTDGWLIHNDILNVFNYEVEYIEKSSYAVDKKFKKIYDRNYNEIEIFGLCTDICVIANAIEMYKLYPSAKIFIRSDLCAGTTVENHKMALALMKNMGFEVI